MTPGLFITGTNTGVGKTVVTAAILRLLAAEGVRAVGLKPIASGSERRGSGRAAAQRRRARTAGRRLGARCPTSSVNPVVLRAGHRPAPRGRRRPAEPSPLDALVEWYERVTVGRRARAGRRRGRLAGAAAPGRIPERPARSPRTRTSSWWSGTTLGCLNHARLTAEAIHVAGRCRLVGLDRQRDRPGLRAPGREPGHPRAAAGRAAAGGHALDARAVRVRQRRARRQRRGAPARGAAGRDASVQQIAPQKNRLYRMCAARRR